MTDVSAREIRVMLQARLPELLAKLFPRYSFTTPVFTPLNPTRADKHPGSFVIWTAGAAAGGFNEYSPRGPATSGDIIDLCAYVHGREGDRRFALAFARDFLGLKQMDPAALAAAKRQAKTVAAQAATQQSDVAKAKILRANEIWTKTVPLAGSLGEIYYASRRIPLQLIRNREDDLRFMPRLEHWKSAKWDKVDGVLRKTGEGPRLPAIVAALRNLAGDITAVHCTFLRADGSGKADVSEAKLMRGIAKGSAVWLARGPSDAPMAEAIKTGEASPLIVSEGIENGLSVAFACPEARVAAAGSFDLMMALDVTPPIFDPVIFALDNDNNPKADETIADRLDELRALGKRATTMRASGAKDFNDVL